MSISDEAMPDYFRLLLGYENAVIDELKKVHPMEAKKRLAFELTSKFFNSKTANNEQEEFGRVFSKGKLPEEMPTFIVKEMNLEKDSILNVLNETNIFGSKGEIRRLIKQGAVKSDGVSIKDPEDLLSSDDQVSRKWSKLGRRYLFVS